MPPGRLPKAPMAGELGKTRLLWESTRVSWHRLHRVCLRCGDSPLASALLDGTYGWGLHALLDQGAESTVRVTVKFADVARQGHGLEAGIEGGQGVAKVASEGRETFAVLFGESAQMRGGCTETSRGVSMYPAAGGALYRQGSRKTRLQELTFEFKVFPHGFEVCPAELIVVDLHGAVRTGCLARRGISRLVLDSCASRHYGLRIHSSVAKGRRVE